MLFIPELLDVDRLHETIEKIHKGLDNCHRGEGATLARLYLMLGEVELGDDGNQYLYIGENSYWAKEVAGNFLELVYEKYPEMRNSLRIQVEPEWRPDLIVLPNKQMYRFFSIDQLIVNNGTGLFGFHFDKIFFDVSEDKQKALDARDTNLMSMLEYLDSLGAEFV